MDLYDVYNEMSSKYGFNEGDTPEGIEFVRDKMIGWINEGLLENSRVEAYAVDRMGVHNWCIIGFRNKKTKKETGRPDAEIREILRKAAGRGWRLNLKIEMLKDM